MKKLLLFLLMALVLVGSALAFQPKDKYVSLVENTDQCLTDCYTVYKITAEDRAIQVIPDVKYRTGQDNRKKAWTEIADIKEIRYLKSADGSAYDGFDAPVILNQSESLYVKIEGKKTAYSSIDNILNIKLNSNIWKLEIFDKTYEYDEYAWWDSNWKTIYPLEINNVDTHIHNQSIVILNVTNGTFVNCSATDMNDLRIVWMNTTQINYSWYDTANHKGFPEISFLVNTSTGTNNQIYYIYCDNPTATDTSDKGSYGNGNIYFWDSFDFGMTKSTSKWTASGWGSNLQANALEMYADPIHKKVANITDTSLIDTTYQKFDSSGGTVRILYQNYFPYAPDQPVDIRQRFTFVDRGGAGDSYLIFDPTQPDYSNGGNLGVGDEHATDYTDIWFVYLSNAGTVDYFIAENLEVDDAAICSGGFCNYTWGGNGQAYFDNIFITFNLTAYSHNMTDIVTITQGEDRSAHLSSPVIGNISMTPATIYQNTPINCTINITDEKVPTNLTIIWEWWKNDVNQSAFGGSISGIANKSTIGTNISVTLPLLSGSSWNCTMYGRNPNGSVSTYKLSLNRTVNDNNYNITETYNTNINETASEPYTLETNWAGSQAKLMFNGTEYTATMVTNATGYSKFTATAIVPLVAINTTDRFYWNYTQSNMTWTNKSSHAQNVKMAYYIKLQDNIFNSTYMETQIFKAIYNMTNYSNKASIEHYFVAHSTKYSAAFNQSADVSHNNYISSITTPNASLGSFNLAGVINVSFGGYSYIRTSNTSIDSGAVSVFECTNESNTTIIRFFIDEEDGLYPLNTTTFEAIFELWSTDPNSVITINYSGHGKTNYSFCLLNNATAYADIYIKYDARFTHRYYLLNVTLDYLQAKNYTLYNFNKTTESTSSSTTTTYPATTTTSTTQVFYNDTGNYSSTSTTTQSGYSVTSTTPLTAASTLSGLKITIRNKVGYDYMQNVIGKMQRWYVGENVWRTVQMDKSGEYGLMYYNIYEKDKDYRFIFVDENDCILKRTDNLKFVCTNAVCDVTYLLSQCSDALTDNFTVNVLYDNATGNVTTVWDDPAGGTTQIRTITTRETMTGTATICDSTLSGASGSYNCHITGYTGTIRTTVLSTTNGVTNNKLTVYHEAAITKIMNLISSGEGAMWAFGIMLTVATFGVFSPVGAIITTVIGLIFLLFLGIFSPITMTLTIVACVIGVAIGLKVKS